MKLIIYFLLSCLAPGSGAVQSGISLGEHLAVAENLLDDIRDKAELEESYPEAAALTRHLRSHLVDSIGLTPEKFLTQPERSRHRAMVGYHQIMARAIYLTASLERALNGGQEFWPESASRNDDIRNLMGEVEKIVQEACLRFL